MGANQEGFFKLLDLKFTSINLLGFSFLQPSTFNLEPSTFNLEQADNSRCSIGRSIADSTYFNRIKVPSFLGK
jgi:hypothetical protein